jgi:hypothetical protein
MHSLKLVLTSLVIVIVETNLDFENKPKKTFEKLNLKNSLGFEMLDKN